jgi:hypothetical protein
MAREVPARTEMRVGAEPDRVQAENPIAPPTALPFAIGDGRAVPVDPAPAATEPPRPERGGPCFVVPLGLGGECMVTSVCSSLGGHMSNPGYCPGPSTVACCTAEPVVDAHPRPPTGWMPVPQSRVSTQMTGWALMIVGSPTAYPMGATTTAHFGPVEVMARVEWHPPDFGHGVVHRGVTLYQPG